MKVGLVYPPGWIERNPLPPAGIAYLAQALKNKWYETKAYDLELLSWADCVQTPGNESARLSALTDYDQVHNFLLDPVANSELKRSVEWFLGKTSLEDMKLVGFSVMGWNQLVSSAALARGIKQKTQPIIVFGGCYATSHAQEILDHLPFVDFVILGEGWAVLPQLVEVIYQNRDLSRIPGLAFRKSGDVKIKKPRIENLDEAPTPDYSSFDTATYRLVLNKVFKEDFNHLILHYLVATGCPYRCSFCRRNERTSLRFRKPSLVVEDLVHLSKQLQTKLFILDCSEINPGDGYADELCDALLTVGADIIWYSYAVPHKLDAKTIAKLANAGCRMLRFGVESGSQRLLTLMRKPVVVEDAELILRDAHSKGIWNQVNFIVGYPHENSEDIKGTLKFIRRNARVIDGVRLHPFFLHPASPMFATPSEYGIRIGKVTHSTVEFDEVGGLTWHDRNLATREAIEMIGNTVVKEGIGFSGISSSLTFSAIAQFGKAYAKEWLQKKHPNLFTNKPTEVLRWHLYHSNEISSMPFPDNWEALIGQRYGYSGRLGRTVKDFNVTFNLSV